MDVVGTKATSADGFTPPPPPSKTGLKLACNVNIVYGNLKSDNTQDYDKKLQRNCTFMNTASVCEAQYGNLDSYF